MNAIELRDEGATNSTPTVTRRPRLGFLGVGWIGRHRLEAVVRSGLAEVVAIAEPLSANAQEAVRWAPEARRCLSLQQMLEIDLDGIVIATPSAQHARQAVQALDRGLAVFCQKPLGRTAAETREIIKAARAADRLLGVDLSYRHIDGLAGVRERIRRGDLGEIFAVDTQFHNAYGPDKPWFYNPELSGGGCVIDLGIHLVDLARWMLDFPCVTTVSSRLFSGGRPVPDGKVEDYAIARLDFDSGVAVQLACSWNLSRGCEAIIEAIFYGTLGGVALRNLNGSFYDFTVEQYRGTNRATVATCTRDWGGRAAVAWVECLAHNSSFDPEILQLVATAEALDFIYQQNSQ